MCEFTLRDSEEGDAEVFGPTLTLKLIIKKVPVFDETDIYQIRFLNAGSF
jgi:hypothetical protein